VILRPYTANSLLFIEGAPAPTGGPPIQRWLVGHTAPWDRAAVSAPACAKALAMPRQAAADSPMRRVWAKTLEWASSAAS